MDDDLLEKLQEVWFEYSNVPAAPVASQQYEARTQSELEEKLEPRQQSEVARKVRKAAGKVGGAVGNAIFKATKVAGITIGGLAFAGSGIFYTLLFYNSLPSSYWRATNIPYEGKTWAIGQWYEGGMMPKLIYYCKEQLVQNQYSSGEFICNSDYLYNIENVRGAAFVAGLTNGVAMPLVLLLIGISATLLYKPLQSVKSLIPEQYSIKDRILKEDIITTILTSVGAVSGFAYASNYLWETHGIYSRMFMPTLATMFGAAAGGVGYATGYTLKSGMDLVKVVKQNINNWWSSL